MTITIKSAAVIAAALAATLVTAVPVSAQEHQEVRVRRAAARMVVIVEDRTDVAVEIEPGTGGLPMPTVTRVRNEIRIDGTLPRRAIRQCRSGPDDARQPGEGASVEVRGHGRVDFRLHP